MKKTAAKNQQSAPLIPTTTEKQDQQKQIQREQKLQTLLYMHKIKACSALFHSFIMFHQFKHPCFSHAYFSVCRDILLPGFQSC